MALRLALWAHLARDPASLLRADSPSYLAPAANLAAGNGFSSSPAPPYAPEAFRTPVYPAFLAACRLATPDPRLPSALQALLDAGTAVLAVSAAAALAPGPWTWAAALFYGLEPMTIAHSPLILSETLFGFLFIASLLFLLRAGPEGRAAPAFAAGLLLGACTVTRPISAYLWLLLCLALAPSWRRRPRALAALALGACLLPGLWCARNDRRFGVFSLSSITGINLLYYDGAAALSTETGRPVEQEAAQLHERAAPLAAGMNPMERSRLETALALGLFARHPLAVARVHLVSGIKMLFGPGAELLAQELYGDRDAGGPQAPGGIAGRGTLGVLRRHPSLWLIVGFDGALLALVYLLSLRGALVAWRRGSFLAAAWLVPLVYLLVISTGGWCYYRFRVPLWPLFTALAAAGLP